MSDKLSKSEKIAAAKKKVKNAMKTKSSNLQYLCIAKFCDTSVDYLN